jgi:hypothetical protein
MKNKYMSVFRLSFVMLLVSVVFLNSCTDPVEEEVVVETTVAEDKVNIQKTFDDVLLCMEDFKQGNAVDAILRDFINLSNGEVMNDVWMEELFSDLSSVISLDDIDTKQRFDIAFYAATYTYNISSKTWSKSLDQNNRVVFEFPSSPSETSNNASFVIENYVDERVTIDTETIFLPTSFDVIFSVDAAIITEVNLNSVQYASNADFEIPTALDIAIFIDPIEMSLVVSKNSTTSFSLVFTAQNEGMCNLSLDAGLELAHDDYENLNSEDIKEVTVVVQLNDLKIQSLSGIAELMSIEDPTANEINTILDMEVLFKDVKIGDLEYDEDNDAVNIVYKDGTVEDTAKYHEGFFEDLADLWVEFFG